MTHALDNFYLEKDDPNQSCLLALRDLILSFNTDIEAVWKYRLPCFIYKGKLMFYLWIDKKTIHPYVAILCNHRFKHPQLIAGKRKMYKLYMVDPNEDIDKNTLYELLDLAIIHNG